MKFLMRTYDFFYISVKLVLLVLRFAGIALWIILTSKGLVEIYSLVLFESVQFDKLLESLLHIIEILFIAPIPMMIMESFRSLVAKVFPEDKKVTTNENTDEKSNLWKLDKTISSEYAEKAFISSLIGVTSTYLIGKLFDLLDKIDLKDVDTLHIFKICLIIGPIFLFIIIQMFYLKSLKEEK